MGARGDRRAVVCKRSFPVSFEQTYKLGAQFRVCKRPDVFPGCWLPKEFLTRNVAVNCDRVVYQRRTGEASVT
jgi:hypothetical protein